MRFRVLPLVIFAFAVSLIIKAGDFWSDLDLATLFDFDGSRSETTVADPGRPPRPSLVTVEALEDHSGAEAAVRAAGAGFTTVAIELAEGAVPLFDIELGSAVCLVVGHEERGVHRDTLAAVDHVGFLPQLGKVGSLNVAQATTTALYEAARQAASR